MHQIFIPCPQKRKGGEKNPPQKRSSSNCLSFDIFCFFFWLCGSHQHLKHGCGFPALSFTFYIHCSICLINPIPFHIKISWDVDLFCSGSADCVCTIHGRISLCGDVMLWLLVWMYENIVFLNRRSRFRADMEEGEVMRELCVQHFYL